MGDEYNTAMNDEKNKKTKTLGGLEIDEIYTGENLKNWDAKKELGTPGTYPFTRGPYSSMYRGKLWTMRQFAGFGSPENTNQRFHYLLAQGQTGLSTAFDMPTLMGYDADHVLARGEVGREGVSVSTIEDMQKLFAGIDLSKVSTSMTINCSAAPILAMYFALAKRQGLDLNQLRGTIQNDILKEYIAQKEWICPPEAGVEIVCDMIEYCSRHASKFSPVSISGYHIREAGATAVQELAFTIYDGITYVERCLARGLDVDSFAPRLSFFFDVHNDFFEEIAKLRAARRIWAKLMKERFKAKNDNSMALRMHCQTAGVSLTAQQPINNVARVSLQALAAVLGGTQSLHTNSMDETLALPSEEAATVALRTQQIIAEETGVANTIDPLAGSYFVESLTDTIEQEVFRYIEELDNLGGMIRAIEKGFPQQEIAESAYRFQKEVEKNERIIVGVNRYSNSNEDHTIPIHKVDPKIEENQIKHLQNFKNSRSAKLIEKHLGKLREACLKKSGIMEVLVEAVENGVTTGEACQIFREVYGEYKDPGMF